MQPDAVCSYAGNFSHAPDIPRPPVQQPYVPQSYTGAQKIPHHIASYANRDSTSLPIRGMVSSGTLQYANPDFDSHIRVTDHQSSTETASRYRFGDLLEGQTQIPASKIYKVYDTQGQAVENCGVQPLCVTQAHDTLYSTSDLSDNHAQYSRNNEITQDCHSYRYNTPASREPPLEKRLFLPSLEKAVNKASKELKLERGS